MRICVIAAVAMTACVALGISGCAGSSNSGSSITSTTASAVTAESPTLPFAGAPVVENPLDTKLLETDPCSVVADAQMAVLAGSALKDSGLHKTGVTNSCTWNLVDGLGQFNASVLPGDGTGLSSYYQEHAAGGLKQFEVLAPIDGYPAVVATDNPSEGYCPLRVGLRDSTTYFVVASLSSRHPHYQDPCFLATKIADLAIKRLQGN